MTHENKKWIWVFLAVLSQPAFAYDPKTHEVMTERAAMASVLLTDSRVLKNLGVTPDAVFPSSQGAPFSIVGLMKRGANLEDTLSIPRATNHFFNPINGQPLTIPFITLNNNTSPSWALEDKGEVQGSLGASQDFSYREARRYLHKALTSETEQERSKNFGLTFQTLGHIVHHLQDMAQPQHVRNEQHLPIVSDSFYEKYTHLPEVEKNLFKTTYDPVYINEFDSIFKTPRLFWGDKVEKAGIAYFTNSNFVSAGTNFNGSSIYGTFALPKIEGAEEVKNVSDLCADNGPYCERLLALNLGSITFVGNKVEDHFRPAENSFNQRAASKSLYHREFFAKSGKPVYVLNRFNYDAALTFLIRRAVGYSAGLINYFFRGNIDMYKDEANLGRYVIENKGPDDLKGDFTLYYDAIDGGRYPVSGETSKITWLGRFIAKNQKLDNLSFQEPTVPQPKEKGKYILVFNGDMGFERATLNTDVAAVTSKTVSLIGPDFYVAPAGPERAGRLGRLSSDGTLRDERAIEGGGFVHGLMTYGNDNYQVITLSNGLTYGDSIATKNGIVFQQTYGPAEPLNDIAGNENEIFVMSAGTAASGPSVSVYDLNSVKKRSFPVLPNYANQGGFIQLVAQGNKLVASANYEMRIYDTSGAPLVTVNLGPNVYESILAASSDRIFRANFREQTVQIYDFNGMVVGTLWVTSPAKITCMDATESKLYVVTSDNVGGATGPWGGRVHVFERDVTLENATHIPQYQLASVTSLPASLDSWHHACSVDHAP